MSVNIELDKKLRKAFAYSVHGVPEKDVLSGIWSIS